MASTLTLTELTNALKSVMAAINSVGTSIDVRLHELHELATRIDAKMDRLEHPNVEIEQPKASRAKKATKAPEVSVVKRRTTTSKKVAESDGDMPVDNSDEEEEPKPKPKSKSKAVPKSAPKRVTVQSAFKDKYKEDPSYFDEYITEDVRLSLSDENPGLNTLSGDKLLALQLKVYYTFIKETYPDVLTELKAAMM